MALSALLFDMDGTLVDSDPVHFRAYQSVAARHGVALDRTFFAQSMSGRSNAAICATLWPDRSSEEQARIADEKEALYRTMLAEVAPIQGLGAFLDWADRQSLGLAVVSNGPRRNLDAVLAALGLTERFRVLVSGEELERGKPDPLPYQTALEQLGVTAGAAMAFEDALPGLHAAVAAAIPTAGLTSTSPAEPLQAAGAVLTIENYDDPRLWAYLDTRL